MGCFCAVPEEFYCEVLLLDESKLTLTTQHQGIKKSTKGSVVLDHVFRHVNLVEIDYFGLRYCDRSHQTYWLDPAKTLAEHKELIKLGFLEVHLGNPRPEILPHLLFILIDDNTHWSQS